jgi:hypothetical protein
MPSTARSVPERCGRLVWRRARPCEPHAHESNQPYDSNEPCDPNESYEPNARHACESNESNNSNKSGQCTVTA